MVRASSATVLAALLGLAAAALVSCGGSSGTLIPIADAGPLQSDFETVAQAAEAGDGDCSATRTAIAQTEHDFHALPATVDSGLRATLRQGIDNLRARALVLCAQPLVQTTTNAKTTTGSRTTTTTTSSTPSTTTTSTTAPTTSTPATSTPTPSTPGGGTVAPGPGEGGSEEGGGTGAGEAGAGEGASGSSGSAAGGSGAAGAEGGR